MRNEDFDAFGELLDGCYELLSPGKAPSATAKALFFRALGAYSLSDVRRGLDAHIKAPKRGTFAPKPSDVIEQIEGLVADDGRPGVEEAWAMCCRAADESETLVWSAEMSEAYAVASSLMQEGDQIGARMAFKEAYGRMVDDARRARRPVSWSVSLGHDVSKRHGALVAAEARGLLAAGEALRLAPPAADMHTTATLLLENAAKAASPETVKERIAALKALLVRPEPVSRTEQERDELQAKKRQAAEAVAAYERNQA